MPYQGSWARTVDAATEPITTAEAKTQLVVDHSDDDTFIDTLIVAARKYCERFTRRALITQTWVLSRDEFPSGATIGEGNTDIYFPVNPVLGITTLAYTDTAGDAQTLSAGTGYQLDTNREPGRVTVPVSGSWPAVQTGKVNAVQITFTAGYGAASAVPEDIKHAIKLLVAHWYENREAVAVGVASKEIEFAVKAILMPYIVVEIQ